MQEKVFIKNKSGLKLCGVWHFPKKSTNKAIVLAHGLTVTKDESGVFTELAGLLENNGFTVFRFDFRGHGESEGAQTDMTIRGELEDLKSSIQEVELKGFANIGLLGASFGGGIATLYASETGSHPKSLCLWNPVLNYDHCFLNPITPWLKDKKIQMQNDLSIKGYTEIGKAKFKCSKVLFNEMKEFFPYRELKQISVPTVIIHGNKDSKVPYEDSKRYISSLKPHQLITVKGAEHGFHEDWEREIANQETLKFFQKYL